MNTPRLKVCRLTARCARQEGFTLVEIIAALALLGVLTAVFGMGLVEAVKSFAFSRENVRIAQKGQLAMARVSRELMELIAIRAVSEDDEGPFIIYERVEGDEPPVRYGLKYHRSANTLRMYELGQNDDNLEGRTGHLLSDGVTRFDLHFEDADPWLFVSDFDSIFSIGIHLELARRDDPANRQQFSTRVYLRKTPYISGLIPLPMLGFAALFPAVGYRGPLIRRKRRSVHNINGTALVVVVVSILIFGVLAAAIIPMVSTSSQQVAVTDASARVLYLAESGFRYAESRWNANASEADRHDALEALDGTYTLVGDDGEFTLRLQSYFLELAQEVSGLGTFQVRCPGSFPFAPSILVNQKLRIGEETVEVQAVVDEEEDHVVIALPSTLSYYPRHTLIRLVTDVDGTQTLSNNSELSYNGNGEMLPLRNGAIIIGDSDQIITYRFNNRDENRLVGLNNPLDTSWTMTAEAGDAIVLMPSVRLYSTGRAGADDLRVERELIFDAPLSIREDLTLRRRITDMEGVLFTSAIGGHEAADIDGNRSLTVTESVTDAMGIKSSLTELSLPADTLFDFGRSSRGTGGYLSYDAQVKVGFYSNPTVTPSLGFYPAAPIPAYFSAGPAFRLRQTADGGYMMYGLGFTRGNSAVADGLPDEIIPSQIQDRLAIVLWQQTNNGLHRNWLAYKVMSDYHTYFDFESGHSGWTSSATNGTWRLLNDAAEANSPSHCYHFRDNGNNQQTIGVLNYQPELPLPESDSIRLGFYSKLHNINNDPISTIVRIRENGGPAQILLHIPSDTSLIRDVDLTAYAGSRIELLFYYHNSNSSHPADWYIDDVYIEADWPVLDSTLVARPQEAAALVFANGGPGEIQKGDWVIGGTSGARGRVAFEPILGSVSWSDRTAAGVLQLNRVSGAFSSAGEELNVIGKGRCATSSPYNETTDRKVNFIKAYYGRAQSFGTTTINGIEYGDTNRFNAVMLGNPRLSSGEVPWPPDDDQEWTAARDRFRLIEWDEINPAVSNLSFVPWQLDGLRNEVIIRSYHPDLESGSYPAPELGLYAFGDGAVTVYFDDFGLQIDMPVRSPFPPPLQQ
jgi:prepilin-type N-terminal cleavage/methylation domain-containing protein